MSSITPAKILRHGSLAALSYLRERRLRMPSLAFHLSSKAKKATTPLQRDTLAELRKNGIVRIPGFLPPELIETLRQGMQEMAEAVHRENGEAEPAATPPTETDRDRSAGTEHPGAGAAVATEDAVSVETYKPPESQYDQAGVPAYWNPEIQVYASNDPFYFRQQLYDVVLNDDIVSIVNSYFGKQVYLGRGQGVRHLPFAARDRYQWAWHHDGWGRKLNVQIVLTDLGEDGNHLLYKMGSHKQYRGYSRFRQTNLTDAEVEASYGDHPTFSSLGAVAGDVIILDANGIHRARSGATLRDANLVMFYPDATFSFGHQIEDETLEGRSADELRPLEQLFKTNKINAARNRHDVRPLYGVNWVESLPHVWRWLF